MDIINEQLCSQCHTYNRAKEMKQALFLVENKLNTIAKNLKRLKLFGIGTDRQEKAFFRNHAEFRALFHSIDVDAVRAKSSEYTQRLEIIDYEERYKGIDITKLHEQIQYLQSQTLMAQLNEKALENDVLKFRERIYKLAAQYNPAGGQTAKDLKARSKMPWRGPEEVDELCRMFSTFLAEPKPQIK